MSVHSHRRHAPALFAAGTAVLLFTAACSGTTDSAGTAATTGPAVGIGAPSGGSASGGSASTAPNATGVIGQTSPEDVAAENVTASCMKAKGFTYIPHAVLYESPDSPRARFTGPNQLLRSDAELRNWRQKYGFGYESADLYPRDPQVAMASTVPNPNEDVVNALDPARRKAYNKALTGVAAINVRARKATGVQQQGKVDPDNCERKAEKVRQKAAAKAEDATKAERAEAKQQMARFVNAADVQRAVKKYVRCLAGIGQKPQSYSIAYIANAASDAFAEKHPDPVDPSSPAARALLTEEISAALAELPCRAPLAELVRTKYPEQPAAALNGGSDGLG